MPSDSVSGLILKNSPVHPHTLRTNPKFFRIFPIPSETPQISLLRHYKLFWSDPGTSILKTRIFGKSSEKTFRNAVEGFRILRTHLELSKQHCIVIINSYLSIRSPKHGLKKSHILLKTYIIFRIDLIYSDFTRILPITQIQYTQAYSTHFISIHYTTKLLGAPEY